MDEEKLGRVLPEIYKAVKIKPHPKELLRQKLFGCKELTEDELSLVSAAGKPDERETEPLKTRLKEDKKHEP